jgi:hypothetical protein
LLANYFGVGLENPSYRTFTGNVETLVDLRVFPEWQGKEPGAIRTYGIRNPCQSSNDVLKLDGIGTSLGTITSQYVATNGGAVANAGVFKRWNPSSPWMALMDGWDIENLTTRFDTNTINRSAYFFEIFTNVWAAFCGVAGTPLVPLDVPSFGNGDLVDFVTLKNNPVRTGLATVSIGVANPDRVEIKVYDLGGRLVRTLVDRLFAPGRHEVVWDGLDDGGRRAARGVYFSRVRYRGSQFAVVRKVTVLR